jgi:uncharacterized protein (DUF1015 family)
MHTLARTEHNNPPSENQQTEQRPGRWILSEKFLYCPDRTHSEDIIVATIRPFKGYRPPPNLAARVASKPYDVLTSDEARDEAKGNPLSFLRIGKPEIDLPDTIDLYDPQVYAKGRENLDRFVKEGILQPDKGTYLYLYGLSTEGHEQYGIVSCLSVREYEANIIRRHELTRPDKEDDRTRHIESTRAHSGPVLLAFRSVPDIDAFIENTRAEKPAVDFVAPDGVRHQLWVVENPDIIGSVVRHFADLGALYIADGHHRAAAAARVAATCKAGNPRHTGNEEYNFFLGVSFPHSRLTILDYNRVVSTLNGLTPEKILEMLATRYSCVETADEVRPSEKGQFGFYMRGQWYTFTITPGPKEAGDAVASLDASLLQNHILGPILGIRDPRTDKHIEFVGGSRGLKELVRRVDSGVMMAAFSLHPPSMKELLKVADDGKIMPPKSTWFEPKLRDGMVVHFID